MGKNKESKKKSQEAENIYSGARLIIYFEDKVKKDIALTGVAPGVLALYHKLRGPRFNSGRGTCLDCGFGPWFGGVQEVAD